MSWRDLPMVRDFSDLDLAEIDTWPWLPKTVLALVIYGALLFAGKLWWLDPHVLALTDAGREHIQLRRKIEAVRGTLAVARIAQAAAQAMPVWSASGAIPPPKSESVAPQVEAFDLPTLRWLRLIERCGLRVLALRVPDPHAMKGQREGVISLRVSGSFAGLRDFMRALAEDTGDDEFVQWKLESAAGVSSLTLDLSIRRPSLPSVTPGRGTAAARAERTRLRKIET